jgi:uncharacterized protein
MSLNQIVLTITERCSQRCSYCYVPTERGRVMKLDVAKRALDLFFARARETGPLSIAFFGGEPFLAPRLMRRIVEAAVERAGGRQVVFSATTNVTAVDDVGLEVVRELGLKLAVSHDGDRGQRHRPLRSGEPSLPALRRNLERLLELDGAVGLARMTVTPENVQGLADNVRSVFAAGIRTILYVPAYEASWDELSVERFYDQHRRLVTWLAGLAGSGRQGPIFPAWRDIRSRLLGSPREHCGAGTCRLAVSVDGEIHPCYRTLYLPRREELCIGDVWSGVHTRSRLADLSPAEIRPREGRCDTCPVSDGCTFFCPALGHLISRDIRVVPPPVCGLMRAQVETCRRLLGKHREAPARPSRLRWAAVLAAAFLGGGLTSCHRVALPPTADAGPADITAVDSQGDLPLPDFGPFPDFVGPPPDRGEICLGYGGIC